MGQGKQGGMIDIRPVANIVGKLVATLGAAMSLPLAVDLWYGNPHWQVWLETGFLTVLVGVVVAMTGAGSPASRQAVSKTHRMTAYPRAAGFITAHSVPDAASLTPTIVPGGAAGRR